MARESRGSARGLLARLGGVQAHCLDSRHTIGVRLDADDLVVPEREDVRETRLDVGPGLVRPARCTKTKTFSSAWMKSSGTVRAVSQKAQFWRRYSANPSRPT